MKVVTREQMEYIDKTTTNEYGIPSIILMENAGISILNKILELYPQIAEPKTTVTILIGAGNNGGDGLVIARQLFNKGIEPFVVILFKEEKFKGDALTNLSIAKNIGIDIAIAPDQSTFDYQKKKILSSDFIIDAIFGTGLSGEPREFESYVINQINTNFKNIVIAVDVPSGITSEIGIKSKTILKANDTITVALPKINTVDYPEKTFVGKQSIVQIGFPQLLLKDKKLKYNLISMEEAALLLNERPADGHKGTFGKVLVIAGSKEYSGAAILTSMAALKSGAGLVLLASVPSVCDSVRSKHPEIICVELVDDDSNIKGNAFEKNLSTIKKYIDGVDAIVMGPGVNGYSMGKLIREILTIYRGKVVLDAGGINLFTQDTDSLKKISASVVITPHIKEFSRLVKIEVNEIIENKIGICKKFCEEYNLYIVLKSAVTLFADYNENIYFNSSGNSGLATAGSGDVLSGIIGGFCGQGYTIPQASILGVFLHGLTADLIVKEESEHTLTAHQIIDNLYKAIKEVKQYAK